MKNGFTRSAVIGTGLLGMRHAQFLANHRHARLVAVADVRADSVQNAAEKTGARAYVNYEEMLEKEELDLVLVETPDSQHAAPAIACCRAGVRNLVIQKPLSTTVAEGEAILAAATAAGTRVFVWYENRGFGTDMATRHAIREGLIGRVVYGDCGTDNNILTPQLMWGDRTRDWVAHSSPANFLASHTIDRLFWYFTPARITRVFAIAQSEVLGYTPDLYDAFLFFDTGLKIRVKAGWINHIEGKIESTEVFNGATGQIYNYRHPRFNTQAGWRANLSQDISFTELRQHQEILRTRGIGSRIIRHDPVATGWAQGRLFALEVPIGEALKHELLTFILDAIRENTYLPQSWQTWQGDTPLVDGATALNNVRVIHAIQQSASTGLPVELPSS